MTTQEFAVNDEKPNRVVEVEIKLPSLGDVKWPEIDTEPLRGAAEQILLTTIGVGILIGRGIVNGVEAAHRAGQESAKDPGPISKALLSLVRSPKAPVSKPLRMSVPVLPISDYGNLDAETIEGRLDDLSTDQLQVLQAYEVEHEKRTMVLEAIASRLQND